MSSLRYPENFVAYLGSSQQLKATRASLAEAAVALGKATSPQQASSIRTEMALREIQEAVLEGDQEFRAERYGSALVAYRAAAQKILALIDPGVAGWSPPRDFVLPDALSHVIEDVSAGLLASMGAPAPVEPAVPLPSPVVLDPGRFGCGITAQIVAVQPVPRPCRPRPGSP